MVVLAAIGVACGSDDDGSSSVTTLGGGGGSASGGADPAAVAPEVVAFVEEKSQEPGLALEPLEAAPEPGRSMVVIFNSAIPVGISAANQTVTAAEAIGWTAELLANDGSPESFIEAFEQALATDPDVIDVGGGWEPETFADALAQAHAAGVAVIGDSIVAPPTAIGEGGFQVVVDGPEASGAVGALAADWVAVDSNGTATVALVHLEGFEMLEHIRRAFTDEIARVCSGCTVVDVGMAVTDLGTNAPTIVLSTLQANSDIDYIWFDLGDLTRGVVAAIDGAGLPLPKMGNGVPIEENIAGIADGTWSMVVNQSDVLSWYKVHGVAKFLETGEPQSLAAATRILSADNIDDPTLLRDPNTGSILTPSDFVERFEELWHVG